MTAFLALGILVGSMMLAKEVNALGVMAVGKWLRADVSYTTNWEFMPRARVIWTDAQGNSLRRSALLIMGGVVSGVGLIGALLFAIFLVLMAKSGGSYAFEMLGITGNLAKDAAHVWFSTLGIPFRIDFWTTVYSHGVVVPHARELRMELDAAQTRTDMLLSALIWAMHIAAAYMAVVLIPLAGIGSFANVFRRWLMGWVGEGAVALYMDVCLLFTHAVLIALALGEFIQVIR